MDIGPLPTEYPIEHPELHEIPELRVESHELVMALYRLYPKDESIYKKFWFPEFRRTQAHVWRNYILGQRLEYSAGLLKKLRKIENIISK